MLRISCSGCATVPANTPFFPCHVRPRFRSTGLRTSETKPTGRNEPSVARISDFAQRARAIGARIEGLHAHLGSGIESPAHWAQVYSELVGLADRIGTVRCIDIGGGLPIPYTPDAWPFDVAAVEEARQRAEQLLKEKPADIQEYARIEMALRRAA